MKRIITILLLFAVFNVTAASAQVSNADSLFLRQAIDSIQLLYFKTAGENAHIYSGQEYTLVYRKIATHPFFETDDAQLGWVEYNGIRYSGLRLFYNLENNQLLMNGYDQNFRLIPDNSKISRFGVQDHVFINKTETGDAGTNLLPGFYELLHQGNSAQLLEYRKKIYKQSIREDEASRYLQFETYYLYYNNEYHEIGGKRSLLSVLKDKSAELKSFIKRNKLNFKSDLRNALQQTVAYYDQLKK